MGGAEMRGSEDSASWLVRDDHLPSPPPFLLRFFSPGWPGPSPISINGTMDQLAGTSSPPQISSSRSDLAEDTDDGIEGDQERASSRPPLLPLPSSPSPLPTSPVGNLHRQMRRSV